MNRKLYAILLCVLVATSVALAACQPQDATTGPCLAHSDANKDGLCDNCGVQVGVIGGTTSTAPKDVEVRFVVMDDYGEKMVGATVMISSNIEDIEESLVVNDEGSCATTLPVGEYTVIVENLPEFHLAGVFKLEVEPGMGPVALDIQDKTPNGTVEKPYFIGEEPRTEDFNTNEQLWFSMRAGEGRYLIVRNADAEVEYEGQIYYPDTDGVITVRIESEDAKDQLMVKVTNTSADPQQITVELYADPGTADNPFQIDLNQNTVAVVIEGGSVYYEWTATADGSLTVSSTSAFNSITLTNTGKVDGDQNDTGTQMAGPSEGALSLTLNNIKEGDVIRVQVSVVGYCTDPEAEIDFVLTFQAG